MTDTSRRIFVGGSVVHSGGGKERGGRERGGRERDARQGSAIRGRERTHASHKERGCAKSSSKEEFGGQFQAKL
eukprot:3932363-Pleurochrysis_carterae.AAC.2